MTTDTKLVAAAAALLDAAGEPAVTIRAVAQAVGVSHNAPYKHFKSRDALLEAVVLSDIVSMTDALRQIQQSSAAPTEKLRRALLSLVDYGSRHPARYQLLLNDPRFAVPDGRLQEAADSHFDAFDAIVQEWQGAEGLGDVSHITLSGLLFATVHGLVSLTASGRMSPEKELADMVDSLDVMIQLIVRRDVN